ncbi:MAG: hypothetical protein LC663_03425 [Actinobacteria bacterium]|nr:hypothetical protein [Actinomycetota bacterium]
MRWITDLDSGELLGTLTWRSLRAHIDADLTRLADLETKQVAYHAWRETEARQRRHRLSALKQIAHGFDKARREVDEEFLRYCTTCAALAIPETDKHHGARWGYEGPRCLFCQRGDALITPTEAEGRHLIAYEGGFPKTCPVPVPRWVRAARDETALAWEEETS